MPVVKKYTASSVKKEDENKLENLSLESPYGWLPETNSKDEWAQQTFDRVVEVS